MQRLVKVSNAERDIMCENIYNTCILSCSEVLADCADCANVFSEHIPVACFTNFRDALFHFRRMVHTTEYTELVRQSNAIKEHTGRAKTDAITFLLEYASAVVDILRSFFSDGSTEKKELSQLNSDICTYDLNYRLGGLMLRSTPFMRPSDEVMLDFMYTCLQKIQDTAGEEKFQTSLHQYRIIRKKTECDINHDSDPLGLEMSKEQGQNQ